MNVTILLVLMMTISGHDPLIYEDRDIGTIGACFAVAKGFLDQAIANPRNSSVEYQAFCVVTTAPAKDAKRE